VRTALLCSLVLLAAHVAAAQEPAPILVGIGGGVSLFGVQMQSAAIPFYAGAGGNECGEFGSGSNAVTSGHAILSFPSLLGRNWGVTISPGYQDATSSFTALPNDTVWAYDDIQNSAVPVNSEQQLTMQTQRLTVDLMVRNDLGGNVSIDLGLGAGVKLSQMVTQEEVRSGNYRFPDASNRREVTDGIAFTPRDFSLAFMGNLSYQVKLGSRVWAVPHLSVRADLLSPVNEYNWMSFSGGVGGSLLVNIVGSHEESPAPPSLPDTPVVAALQHDTSLNANAPSLIDTTTTATARHGHPTADIDIFSVDDQGKQRSTATVRVYEIINRTRTPRLQLLYFERGSAAVPEREVPTAAEGTTDDTSMAEVIHQPRQMLDTLAAQLLADPDARITLLGSMSRGEAPSLARERVRGVRDYLVGRGVDGGRIRSMEEGVSRLPEGEGDPTLNQYVAIESDMEGRNGATVTEHIEREYDPPSLKLEPHIDAPAGVRQWNIKLLHDGREIAHYSSAPDDTLASRRIDWRIDAEQASESRSLLVGVLTVEDSAGMIATGRSQIPLFIERSQRIVERTKGVLDGSERITWSLLSFTGNSMTPGERNEMILADVASAVRNGARVTVVGYGEDSGLPRRRADRVVTMLREMVRESGRRNVRINAEVENIPDAGGEAPPVAILVEQPAP
jgi:hypothetical protein